MYLRGGAFSVLLGKYLEELLLGHMISVCLILKTTFQSGYTILHCH